MSDEEEEPKFELDEDNMLKIYNILREVTWDIYKDSRRLYYGYPEDDPDQAYWLQ